MIGEAIHDDTLKALVSQHVIREVVVGRAAGDNGKWILSVCDSEDRAIGNVRNRGQDLIKPTEAETSSNGLF